MSPVTARLALLRDAHARVLALLDVQSALKFEPVLASAIELLEGNPEANVSDALRTADYVLTQWQAGRVA